MERSLQLVSPGFIPEVLVTLLLENTLIALLAFSMGLLLVKHAGRAFASPSVSEWFFFLSTILVNTLLTYTGFYFWQRGIISIDLSFSWQIVVHLVVLFIAMDLALYCFHYIIHQTFIYKIVHKLHHSYLLRPINFFIVHPLELIAIGIIWFGVLQLQSFNIYAIVIYVVIHIIFGITSHLGLNNYKSSTLLGNHLVGSSFYTAHYKQHKKNYGYYTIIWDKLFNTYAAS